MGNVGVLAKVVWLELLRRKDLYVLSILLVALTVASLTVDSFGGENVERYIFDLGLFLIWLFSIILVVTLASRQIPGEEKSGTIYPLLAKPVSRLDFILGKWLGCWLASVAALALFYVFLVAVIVLRGGEISALPLLQAWGLHSAMLAVVAAITIVLSTRMSYGAAATLSFVVQAAVFFMVPKIPAWTTYEAGIRKVVLMIIYYILPHFELFDMRRRLVHEWGAISWSTFGTVIVYGGILTIFFLALAWWGYRHKMFKRGDAL